MRQMIQNTTAHGMQQLKVKVESPVYVVQGNRLCYVKILMSFNMKDKMRKDFFIKFS